MTTYVLTYLRRPTSIPNRFPLQADCATVMASVEIHADVRYASIYVFVTCDLPFFRMLLQSKTNGIYEMILTFCSLVPLATLSFHVFLAVWLTGLVGRTIFRSYLALLPSQATRRREEARRSHLKVFSALAAVSLLLAVYWRYSFAALSYSVWADERGVALPER